MCRDHIPPIEAKKGVRSDFRSTFIIVIALIIVGSSGCDIDLFGLDNRTILSHYQLHTTEWGSYYLHHARQDNSGYGVINGTVGKIGWNARYILVWQNPNSGTAGWIVVDSKTETMTQPLQEAEIPDLETVKGIIPIEPRKAWEKLRWW